MPLTIGKTGGLGVTSRLKRSIGAVAVGAVLFLAAFPVLFLNEGRAVNTARRLEFVGEQAVNVTSDELVSANEGRLLHVSGEATVASSLRDPELGMRLEALRLRRVVEMYQWREREEKQRKAGKKKKVTSYRYEQLWSERLIDSDDFAQPEGHRNPDSMLLQSASWDAADVRLGEYMLSPEIVRDLGNFSEVPIDAMPARARQAALAEGYRSFQGRLHRGADPSQAQIGDLRVSYRAVLPGPVSVIAMQSGSGFAPFQTPFGEVYLIADGNRTLEQMVQTQQHRNTMITWLLRGAGFLLTAVGLLLLGRPLAAASRFIPVAGKMLRAGLALFAALAGAVLSLVTIGLAWLTYRPLIGVPLLVLALVVLILLIRLGRSRESALPPPPPPAVNGPPSPPPPPPPVG